MDSFTGSDSGLRLYENGTALYKIWQDSSIDNDFRIIDEVNSFNVLYYDRSAGAVGIGTTSPNANSILDLTSTTKAFMPPRMTTTQKNAISTPTAGMVVYDSTLNKLAVYTGSAWEAVTSA
jgi:hypothetical protein